MTPDITNRLWNLMNDSEKDEYLIILSNGTEKMGNEYGQKMYNKYHKE